VAAGVAHHRVDLGDHAVLVNDQRAALGELLVGHEHAQGGGGLEFRIGQQREGQPLLLGELLLQVERVCADADDDGVVSSKLLEPVAKTASLGRSATGERLGIEEQHDVLLALEVAELE